MNPAIISLFIVHSHGTFKESCFVWLICYVSPNTIFSLSPNGDQSPLYGKLNWFESFALTLYFGAFGTVDYLKIALATHLLFWILFLYLVASWTRSQHCSSCIPLASFFCNWDSFSFLKKPVPNLLQHFSISEFIWLIKTKNKKRHLFY